MNTKALVDEFVGTFTLIFIGVGAIAANQITNCALGLTGIALAHGLAIAIMVSATGAISGGHLNPAVTCGLWSAGKINATNAIGYIIAQCVGGIVAAALIKMAVPSGPLAVVHMGTPAINVSAGVTTITALVAEIVTSFFLIFAVCGTAVDKDAPKVGGLFIGLAVAMGIMMAGPISGGAMNPARHLGPALLGGGLQDIWIYWVGPIVGGVLAATVFFRVIRTS